MKEKNEKQKKDVDPKDRLLASRAKEIRALREDIAGWQESVRLASAFTALLSLALAGDKEARAGVRADVDGDGYRVWVDKSAVREALDSWQVESSAEGDGYRMVFRREPT